MSTRARDVAASVRAGRRTAAEVCQAQIARCLEIEADVQAWQYLAPETALAAARWVRPDGPLAGVTFGVKDVIDTVDMPTEYGSAAYEGTRPPWDAPIVALTRAAGGVILGKTVTTEFAMASPSKTRNPANFEHTPGGSSSGSCAAVAAGMVHVAFGTQTSGSTIRPSSYCGVVGFKPSFGTLNRAAVKMLSDSLDTVGVITGDVRDAAFVTAVLADRPDLTCERPAGLRVGVFRGSRWDQALPETDAALRDAARALENGGVTVLEVAVPADFDAFYAHHDAVMGWETTRSLAYERACLEERLTDGTRAFMAHLAQATWRGYAAALAALRNRAAVLDRWMTGCDVLLTPAAPGAAPQGLESTGDPVFNKVWTLLHGPCVTVPVARTADGLPVGVQLVARLGDDAGLLAAAALLEDALAAMTRGG
jgi:amidase